MDRNLYLELLLKGLDSAKGINGDTIESLLTNMTDLHNTIGKSYEFLVDVISGLMKNINTTKTDESSAKKIKEHTAQIDELKAIIRDLESELERSRQKIRDLEYDNQLKDSTLQDMKGVLNKIDRVTAPQPQQIAAPITTPITTVIPPKENSSNKASAPRKLEDLMPSLSPPTDFSFLRQSLEREQERQQQQQQQQQQQLLQQLPKIEIKQPDIFDSDDDDNSGGPSKLKRKYDEFSKPVMPMMNIEEGDENSKSSSTAQKNNKEDSDAVDDFKFKKVFKKVKRSENNSKSHTGPSNSTSTPQPQPQLITYNSKHKTESFVPKPSLSFDEDNSLHNLLNNFIDNKENSKDKVYSKSNITKKKDSNTKSNRFADDQKLEPKASLSDSEAYETGNSSKIFKKTNEIFNFSQKSPLKSFDLPVDTTNIRSIPITRNGRVSIKSDNSTVNLMQKMLNGHQKRTSGDTQNMFKMSTQSSVDKKRSNDKSDDDILKPLSAFNDEDLVRAPYRTKAERENLQGYDCDQCKKFYDFIADGIHIKSAADHCNKCSRHRDKFPLPATPDNFHDNFKFDSQY